MNAIDEFLSSGELISDERYSYFHNSPHESYPSIKTTNVLNFNYTNLHEKVILDQVPTS